MTGAVIMYRIGEISEGVGTSESVYIKRTSETGNYQNVSSVTEVIAS